MIKLDLIAQNDNDGTRYSKEYYLNEDYITSFTHCSKDDVRLNSGLSEYILGLGIKSTDLTMIELITETLVIAKIKPDDLLEKINGKD